MPSILDIKAKIATLIMSSDGLPSNLIYYCLPVTTSNLESKLGITIIPPTSRDKHVLQEAFKAWQDVINIQFELSSTASCDLAILFSDLANRVGFKTGSFIVLNPGVQLKTALHEIGHYLHLKHPSPLTYLTQRPIKSKPPYLDGSEANYDYTVMAYEDSMQSILDGRFVCFDVFTPKPCEVHTPMIYDVAAAQSLYGANNVTNAGDTQHLIHCNAYRLSTLWDPAGNDEIDGSACQQDALVSLEPNKMNHIGDHYFKIAFGTVIEKVKSGAGNDQIYLGANPVIIATGPGHDCIYVTPESDNATITDYNSKDMISLLPIMEHFSCSSIVIKNKLIGNDTVIIISPDACAIPFAQKEIRLINYQGAIQLFDRMSFLYQMQYFFYFPNPYMASTLIVLAACAGLLSPEIDSLFKEYLDVEDSLEIEMLTLATRMFIRSQCSALVCVAYDISKAWRNTNDYYTSHPAAWHRKLINHSLAFFSISCIYLTKPFISIGYQCLSHFTATFKRAWEQEKEKPILIRAGAPFLKGLHAMQMSFFKAIPGSEITLKNLETQEEGYKEIFRNSVSNV